ncbi:MAG: hypothetical protein II697_05610, partial [Clostridia bacterium]|nr:hypothetical protein [Clostridia bacterium]
MRLTSFFIFLISFMLVSCSLCLHLFIRARRGGGSRQAKKREKNVAACRPEYLWLATAGSGGLSAERLHCLQGRRVILFPDSGCYDKWSRHMQATT